MENLKVSKIKEFLNNKVKEKVKELYLENGEKYIVKFKELSEDWNGEEDVMLYVYGDRGGIDVGFEYRSSYEEDEDWEDVRESDSEMCVYYIFEKEDSKLYERYFDEKVFLSKERLVEI